MEIPMPDKDLDEKVERMLSAAMGGLTPHEALVKASLDEAAKVAERAAAKEKNRERALRLLAELDKAQGKSKS
jgi:ABC-type transporter Mla subunit MlaD